MKPALKRILWITLLLIGVPLLMAAIAIVVLTQINPNHYKERVTQTISQQTGLVVSIGNIGWSFFPWIGLQADDIRLENPQLAATDPARQLLTMGKADIKIKVMPLFSGNVQVGTLRLDQPSIFYQVNAKGISNWQPLINPAPSSPTTASNSTAPPLNIIDIEALVIDQANITYQDATQHWQVNPLNLTIGDIRLQNQILLQPLHIQLDAHAQDNSIAKTELDIQFNAPLSLQIPQQNFQQLIAQLSPLSLQVRYRDASYPHGFTAELHTQLQVDLGKNQLTLNNLQLDIGEAKISGQATIDALTQEPQITAKLNLAPLNLANWLQHNLQLSLDLPADRLQHVSFSGDIKSHGNSLSIKPLQLQVDQSKINGEVVVSNLQQQAVQANLQIDQINLDSYLPAPAPTTTTATTTTATANSNTATAASNSDLFSIDTLRALKLQATLNIAQLQYQKIDMKNTQIKLNANNGLLALTQLQTNLLEGTINASGQLDVRDATPKLNFKPKVEHIQIQPLLAAFQQKPLFTGELNIHGEANTQGQSVAQLTQGLMSQLNVSVDKGALKDVNLLQKVQDALQTLAPVLSALMPNQTLPTLPKALSNDTEFKQLLASATINNGVVQTQQLSAGLDQAQLQGSGNWSLVNDQGELNVQIALSDTLVSPALAAIQWPVNCQINLTGMPKCGIDTGLVRQQLEKSVAAAAKDKAKQKLNEQVKQPLKQQLQQQEEKAKQKAGEQMNKALEKLFK